MKHYSEYSFVVRKLAKSSGVGESQAADQVIRSMLRQQPQDLLHAQITAAEHQVFAGSGTHWFVETEELASFLTQVTHRYQPELLDIVLEHGRTGIIHTPGNVAPALLYHVFSGPDMVNEMDMDGLDKMLKVMNRDGNATGILFRDVVRSGCYSIDHLRDGSLGKLRDETKARLDLIFGMSLYLHCFPHALKPSFPEDGKRPSHFKNTTCATITTCAEVVERGGPSPHFRAGHFRVLRSERFTKKRWQVVWVTETFVKGKCETVEDVISSNNE